MKDGMGFRSSSVPYNMGSPFREQQGHSLAEPAVQKLLSVMPAQSALSTLPSDRAQHAQLLQILHLEQQRPEEHNHEEHPLESLNRRNLRQHVEVDDLVTP